MQVQPLPKSSKGPPTGLVEVSARAHDRFEVLGEDRAERPTFLGSDTPCLPDQGVVKPKRVTLIFMANELVAYLSPGPGAGYEVAQAATTLMRAVFLERGFLRITISTSWSSAVSRFIRRSIENPESL